MKYTKMLDNIKKQASRRYATFESRYIDYLLSIHNQTIMLEMEYIKKHNKLDIFKLDRLIAKEFKGLL